MTDETRHIRHLTDEVSYGGSSQRRQEWFRLAAPVPCKSFRINDLRIPGNFSVWGTQIGLSIRARAAGRVGVG
jgi:hypothetical protein